MAYTGNLIACKDTDQKSLRVAFYAFVCRGKHGQRGEQRKLIIYESMRYVSVFDGIWRPIYIDGSSMIAIPMLRYDSNLTKTHFLLGFWGHSCWTIDYFVRTKHIDVTRFVCTFVSLLLAFLSTHPHSERSPNLCW